MAAWTSCNRFLILRWERNVGLLLEYGGCSRCVWMISDKTTCNDFGFRYVLCT